MAERESGASTEAGTALSPYARSSAVEDSLGAQPAAHAGWRLSQSRSRASPRLAVRVPSALWMASTAARGLTQRRPNR
eukprot:15468118-Alexandrium_andersonii.AAC.1